MVMIQPIVNNHSVFDPVNTRDLTPELIDEQGHLRVVPASVFANTTTAERAVFGHRHALYGFLTTELIDYLTPLLSGRTALEIGAGHGGLARALGIRATDNCMQADPLIKAHYASMGQPVIQYGPNVEKLSAEQALLKYKPRVVLASWVTHKYDDKRHEAGGNMFGVHEESVIEACETYIVIGNAQVHAGKSIWQLPHRKITPPWLYSRATNPSPNFIAIWGKY